MYDPIVAEIRSFRDAHSKKFNYDVKAIAEDYKKKHEKNILLLKEIKNNFNKISSLDDFLEIESKKTENCTD